MPVLPDVASISVSPGLIVPRFSASAIIDKAGRSFTDPAGLFPSSLPRMTFDVFPGRRCKRTSGVWPTVSASVGYMVALAAMFESLYWTLSAGLAGQTKSRPVGGGAANAEIAAAIWPLRPPPLFWLFLPWSFLRSLAFG